MESEYEFISNYQKKPQKDRELYVKNLINYKDDILYKRIGESIVNDHSVLGKPIQKVIEDGKNWFDEWYKENNKFLKRKICFEAKYCKELKRIENEVQLISIIIDTLIAVSINVPIVTVAILLVRLKLDKLCKC